MIWVIRIERGTDRTKEKRIQVRIVTPESKSMGENKAM